jgi:hypothetical protein
MSKRRILPRKEAEACRRQAQAYAGRPEASFLLRVAEEFESLERPVRSSQVETRGSH